MKWFTKLLFFASILCFVACGKKDSITPTPAPNPTPVNIATVTTSFATSVTDVTAISGGNITNNGGATVTESGICYATTTNPTITNTTIVSGTPIGSFASNISSLAPSTLYYVRAYAKNSIGIAYGNELTFTTLAPAATIATVVTNDIIINSNTSATFSGSVTSNGGAPITTTSLVISWNNEVTGAGMQTVSGTTFTKVDCIPGTIYTVKFQATNSAGIANGVNKTGATTGYHIWQDLGYATVYKTVNNANNCYFFGKVDLGSGVGTGIAAGYAWFNSSVGVISNFGGNSLTNGKTNTLNIIANLATASVARTANNYTANGAVPSGTFWCPSNDELVEVLQSIQTTNVPGVSNTFTGDPSWGRYWSSSEYPNSVFAHYATRSGTIVQSGTDPKGGGGAVRPIGYK
jgi:hypothetical protein